MGVYDGTGAPVMFSNIKAERKDIWLWVGADKLKWMVVFNVLSLMVCLYNAITYTIEYFASPIDETLFTLELLWFILAWGAVTLVFTGVSYVFFSNYKKLNCIVISNTNRRIGSKYNWDTFLRDYAAQSEEDRIKHFDEVAEWVREQDFFGEVELILAIEYTFGSVLLNKIRFRFTDENDLILTKTVW